MVSPIGAQSSQQGLTQQGVAGVSAFAFPLCQYDVQRAVTVIRELSCHAHAGRSLEGRRASGRYPRGGCAIARSKQ